MAAENIISKSPLQFDFVPEQTDAVGPFVPSIPGHSNEITGSERGKQGTDRKTTFTVTLFPAPRHAHHLSIWGSPLHGPWPDDEQGPFKADSLTTAALRNTIPKDMVWKGLTDWETGGQLEDFEATQHSRPFTFIERRFRLRALHERSLMNIFLAARKARGSQQEKTHLKQEDEA